MTLEEMDLLIIEYKKHLDEELKKWFYQWKFDKASMMLWWAFEMLLFLNERWLLLPNSSIWKSNT